MPSAQDFLNRKRAFTVMLLGPEGSGKTAQAASFPGIYFLGFDPGGLDVLDNPLFEKRKKNLVWVELLNAHTVEDIYANGRDAKDLKSLNGNLENVKQMAGAGKIQTLVIDGFTYLVALKWDHILRFEGVENTRGDKDLRKSYEVLGSYLRRLMLQEVLPLHSRFGLNIVVTMHVQREAKQTVEGISSENNPAYATSKRQVNTKSDLSPQIMGGFRQMVAGMPSGVIYLEHQIAKDKDGKEMLKYSAYCQKQVAFETQIAAKNRWGLPPLLNLTNGNLYATIQAAVAGQFEKKAAAPAASVAAISSASKQATDVTNTEQKETKS